MLQRALSARVVPSWLQVARLSGRRHYSSNRKGDERTQTRNSEMETYYLQGTIPKQIPRHLHDDFIQLSEYEQGKWQIGLIFLYFRECIYLSSHLKERIYEKYSKLNEPEPSRDTGVAISVDFFTLNQRRQILKLSQSGLSKDFIALQFRVPVEGINDVLDHHHELGRKKPR